MKMHTKLIFPVLKQFCKSTSRVFNIPTKISKNGIDQGILSPRMYLWFAGILQPSRTIYVVAWNFQHGIHINSHERHCVFASNKNHFEDDETENVARKIQRVFECSLKEAVQLLQNHKNLFYEDFDITEKRFKHCRDLGIPKDFIVENVWILLYTENEVVKRLNLLKQWNFKNVLCSLYLIQFSMEKLKQLTRKTIHDSNANSALKNCNRVSYLAEKLNKTESDICKLVYKHSFALTMKFEKLNSTLDIILSKGMSADFVFLDFWIVRYNNDNIKKRFDELLMVLDKSEIKPWMLRCSEEILQRTVSLRDENRSAMDPFANAEEYLCSRLETNLSVIDSLQQRHPPLRQVQVSKLKEILDYLFSEGFEPAQICHTPRVMCHSLATLKERMECCKNLGYKPHSLMTLCKTQKKFSEFTAKLKTTYRRRMGVT